MNRILISVAISIFVIIGIMPAHTLADAAHPRVSMQTSLGEIVLELDRVNAPITVDNFMKYVESGFYNGTIFHRVIDGFMIQGGGYTTDLTKKSTSPPIKNEANNGLKNKRNTIVMARTGDPHSATAQFFINVVDNSFLDHTGPNMRGWGYAVFGKVAQGMSVIDQIRKTPTGPGGMFPKDVPQTPVIIKSVSVIE